MSDQGAVVSYRTGVEELVKTMKLKELRSIAKTCEAALPGGRPKDMTEEQLRAWKDAVDQELLRRVQDACSSWKPKRKKVNRG